MSRKVDFKKISEFQAPEESPGFLLWKASTLWRRAIEDVLKGFDLTHPQFVILATTAWLAKDAEGKPTQAAIGRQAGLDPNTTSQVLRMLQKKELISRERSSDERSKSPQVTKKGSELLAKALPAVEKADHHFFAKLKAKDKTLVQVLQKLIAK